MLTLVRSIASASSTFLLLGIVCAQDNTSPIRPQAVLRFTFDEDSGPATDSATAGQTSDEGKLINDPVRVPSPFWNQSGKKALRLDSARQQFIQVADGPDVDAPQGITVGMFLVNLTEVTDATYHGLFAKRGVADGKTSTNYGINFHSQSDNFQVYIHDGTDFRVATYSAKDAVPFRKLTYVTATFMPGDAPGQDADTDVDDVRIQYFINGEPLVPKAATRGFVSGNEAWITDVNLAGLLNSLPLEIGRSEVAGEYMNCVVGEFLLFPRALSAEEAKKLFIESAGANVAELIAADKPAPKVIPSISSLSQPGLQAGQTTQLIVNGSALGPDPAPVFPLTEVQFTVAEGSTAERLVLNVTVPAETVPGIYPFWVKSQAGISKSVALAIDRLPQVGMGSSPDKPAALPAAFYGNLSGGQQQVVYLSGKKGQRLVADIELKRLGGASNPVLEIKSPSGSPLAIGWGHNSLRGDARVELSLPVDGIYSVELHDLAFNAPGANSFRLKIGDLKLVDGVLPAAAVPGPVELEPVGTGFTSGTRITGTFLIPNESALGSLSLPLDVSIAGGLPQMALSRGTEIVEAPRAPDAPLQTVDVTFSQPPTKPVAISGRISSKGEQDRYLLKVTAGQKLKFTLQTDSIGSSLEGELRLLGQPQGNLLAMTSDQPTIGDLTLEFGVPAGVSEIQIQVRDLFGLGDPRSLYRLVIEPADQPRFSLMLNSPTVNLPEDGSAIIEAQITRAGYAGPIRLSVIGDNEVTVSPNEIAANLQGKTLVRIVRGGKAAGAPPALLRLVGESVGIDPPIRRTARLQTGVVAPTFTDTMAVGTTAPGGLSVELQDRPAVVYRGASQELRLDIKRNAAQPAGSLPVRLTLDSTEPIRKRDPNNPAAGNFPTVTIGPRIVLPGEPEQTSVVMTIPLEIAEPAIDFVIKAEATPHAYSDRVLATAYSQPFRAEIKNAVAPKVDDATLAIPGDVDHKVTGLLQRTAGFAGPVEATLVGLPAGYSVQPANIASDQDKFELVVRAPKVAAETAVANVKLRVTSAGSLLVAEMPVNLKVVP